MKAVVLAGGEGTRLRPYTFVVPKPLLPVGEKPVLQIIIEHLRTHDVDEIVIALGYLGELIKSYFGDGARYGVTLRYLEEAKPLGTAGPLALLGDELGDELIVLMNGDILTKMDFTRLLASHDVSTTGIAVGIKRLEEQSPYGVLEIEGDELQGIVEKPVRVQYINAGMYLLNPKVCRDIPADTYYTMPDLVNDRLRRGERVSVFHVDEPWLAVESAQHLEAANREPEFWTSS